jgi:hypothetical protein
VPTSDTDTDELSTATVSLVTSIGQLLPASEMVETLAPAGLTGWKLWGPITAAKSASQVATLVIFDVLNWLFGAEFTVSPCGNMNFIQISKHFGNDQNIRLKSKV